LIILPEAPEAQPVKLSAKKRFRKLVFTGLLIFNQLERCECETDKIPDSIIV
jgi:hypothetical protein